MKVAVIPADSFVPITVEEVEDINLDYLQGKVGGYIEAVDVSDETGSVMTMWLNEEGKLEGLPYNPRASALAQDFIQPFDVIVGNVVMTGGTDDEGESTGLSEGQIKALLAEYANNHE